MRRRGGRQSGRGNARQTRNKRKERLKTLIHALKTNPKYFEDVISGKKCFEVRKNDRDFQEGDYLALNEWGNGMVDGYPQGYSGRSVLLKIRYILDAPEFCKEGYAVLGLSPCALENIKPDGLIVPVLFGKARGGVAE